MGGRRKKVKVRVVFEGRSGRDPREILAAMEDSLRAEHYEVVIRDDTVGDESDFVALEQAETDARKAASERLEDKHRKPDQKIEPSETDAEEQAVSKVDPQKVEAGRKRFLIRLSAMAAGAWRVTVQAALDWAAKGGM